MNTRLSKTIASAFAQENAERIANDAKEKKVIGDAIISLIDLGYYEIAAEDIVMKILQGKVKHVSIKF